MISALGSHRFNPQTGLWELVTLENAAGVEVSPPAVAELGGLGADGPGAALAEPVTPLPSDDGVVAPVEPVVPVSPPIVPATAPPEPVTPLPSDDFVIIIPDLPVRPGPEIVIERPGGLIIIGGPFPSILAGGDGNDLVIAGALPTNVLGDLPRGDDLLGGGGQDTLIGNELDNELFGGSGADVMIGGGGIDYYIVDDVGDLVIEHQLGGLDLVLSSISYTLPDNVEMLTIHPDADGINGTGNDLNNVLFGSRGRNMLSGGAGDDILWGGNEGGDTLIGGEGADIFLFGSIAWSPRGATEIRDFEVGVDKIHSGVFSMSEFVLPAMHQDGDDTVLTLNVTEHRTNLEIRLIGVDMYLLSQNDFGVGWSL